MFVECHIAQGIKGWRLISEVGRRKYSRNVTVRKVIIEDLVHLWSQVNNFVEFNRLLRDAPLVVRQLLLTVRALDTGIEIEAVGVAELHQNRIGITDGNILIV